MMEWIISSSVLIVVIVILRFMLKGRISLRLQYGLWLLVLVRLLVPFSFGRTDISVMNKALEVPVVQDAESLSGIDEIELCGGGVIEGYQNSRLMPEGPIIVANGKSAAEFSRMKAVLNVRKIFTGVWAFGSAVMFLALAISNVGFRRKLKQGRSAVRDVRSPLPVYASDNVETPCLFGVFKPAIYLTPDAAANSNTMRHVVEHEVTHFRHGDHVWSALRCVCLMLHWYNPLVWLAVSLSRRDAELACDEGTIKRLGEGERVAYGNTLIDLTCEKRGASGLFCAATTMSSSKDGIRERIGLIAKKPKMLWITAAAAVLVAAAAAGCTFTGANTGAPWTWAQELNAGDIISVSIADSDSRLSDGDIKELVSLLNGLEKGDFTENKDLEGGTPTYGLMIETSDGMCPLNGSIAPHGDLEIIYGEKQWWIDNDELSAFVMKVTALKSAEEDPGPDEGGSVPDDTNSGEDEILLTGFSVTADGSMEEIGQAWAEAFVSQYVNDVPPGNPRYSTDAAVFKCAPFASSVSVNPKRFIYNMSFVCDAADPDAFERSYVGWAEPLSDKDYPQYSGWMNFGWFIVLELTDSRTWTCVSAGSGGYGGWGYLNCSEIGQVDLRINDMLNGSEGDLPENLLRVLPFVDWTAFDADNWNKLYQFLDQYCLTEGQVYGPEETRMWKDVYPADQEYRNMYVILAALNTDGAYTEGMRGILKKQYDYDPELFEFCIEENLTADQREIIRSLINS